MIIWILFLLLNVQEFIPIAGLSGIKVIVSASNHASVMSGVVASALYIYLSKTGRIRIFIL